ncbi:hypothetical protein DYB25_011407 [Aphanomyces astaci]|uniref:HTH CENPB-type domain-containing protein n=1 Tax=Aphanomyces astaci TaxID=112090 RepID=A0A397A9K6_APHAT|nr:hypothetical protein DYB25_011407 [Aphanomyces astaci]
MSLKDPDKDVLAAIRVGMPKHETAKSSLICTACAQVIPVAICNTLPYPIKAKGWTCLPCVLGEPFMDAWTQIATNGATIADAAAQCQVDRSKLTRLARWHRIVSSLATPQSTHSHHETVLYTKLHLQFAVQYASEHGCGCRRAARAAELHFKLPMNSIPHATVFQHLQSPRRRGKPGAKLKLSAFEEALVAQQWIMQQENHGVHLTKAEASNLIVVQLTRRDRPNPFANCPDHRPSQGFWRGFLRRHPAVVFKPARNPIPILQSNSN